MLRVAEAQGRGPDRACALKHMGLAKPSLVARSLYIAKILRDRSLLFLSRTFKTSLGIYLALCGPIALRPVLPFVIDTCLRIGGAARPVIGSPSCRPTRIPLIDMCVLCMRLEQLVSLEHSVDLDLHPQLTYGAEVRRLVEASQLYISSLLCCEQAPTSCWDC